MGILYPYQVELVQLPHRFQIHKKARQIGYSLTFAYKAVKNCMLADRDQLFVSASLRQTGRNMYYCEKFIDAFMKLPECGGIDLVIDAKTEKRFTNGKQIICMPNNPDTIRGFPGDVLLDEFALYKDDDKTYEAILPSITGGHGKNKGYSLGISSTTLGLNNKFAEIYNDLIKFKDFHRGSINIYEAVERSAGRFKPDIEAIRANYDEDSFRQEYLGEFIDEQTSYFSYDLLRKCIDDYDENLLKGRSYIGVDIGRSHDLTAIAVMVLTGSRYYLKRIVVLKNTDFQSQFDTICQVIHEENPYHCMIDKGVIGMQLAEMLEKKYGFCEGVQFTPLFINDIVTNGKKLMEQGNFKFYDDRELITQFHSIQRIVTPNNNVKFGSERNSKGHSDSAWACLLGLFAAKNEIEVKMAFVD